MLHDRLKALRLGETWNLIRLGIQIIYLYNHSNIDIREQRTSTNFCFIAYTYTTILYYYSKIIHVWIKCDRNKHTKYKLLYSGHGTIWRERILKALNDSFRCINILVCNSRRYSYTWIKFYVVCFSSSPRICQTLPVFCCSKIAVCKAFSLMVHFLLSRWHPALVLFVFSSLCLNCNDYSHNESVLCLHRNIYVS